MRQRCHNAQRFGARVEHCRQTSPAFLILLFAQGPGLIFDNVFVDACHQPHAASSARENWRSSKSEWYSLISLAALCATASSAGFRLEVRDGYGTSPRK